MPDAEVLSADAVANEVGAAELSTEGGLALGFDCADAAEVVSRGASAADPEFFSGSLGGARNENPGTAPEDNTAVELELLVAAVAFAS